MKERSKVILIVDDVKDLIATLRYRLEDAGFEIVVAENGLECLEKAKERKPDLILLDIMMPRMDGHQTCRALKHDAATRGIPVIMLTAKGQEMDKIKGKEAGADDYVVKPFEGKALVDKIRSFIK